MKLVINTSDPDKVVLSLGSTKHVFKSSRLSEDLLPQIKKFLKKKKVSLSQISNIEAHPGPGHFSRIRTAVATANALAFGLNLPQKMIKPVYDKEPNITKPKK